MLPTLALSSVAVGLWASRRGPGLPATSARRTSGSCSWCLALPLLAFWGLALGGSFAIGYRHMQPVIEGADTLANVLVEMQRDTRHFARRQRTWLRSLRDAVWMDPDDQDGILKAVDLETRRMRDVVCLGARLLDGIRVDESGNYLVSHWEGQLYRIDAYGTPVEILDLQPEGLNAADFEYVAETRTLVIPTFVGNRVVAYRFTE